MNRQMDDFGELERLLREELRPRPAPHGFTERLMLRQAKARRAWRRAGLSWAAAALLFLSVGSGAYWKREHDRRLAGERARDEAILALRITVAALSDVEHKIAKRNKGEME